MRCPVEKPTPPNIGSTSLYLYETDERKLRELWEDEEIKYKCQNNSLVINRVKGETEVRYKCGADGDYEIPSKWPTCTAEPTDPIVISAAELMTAAFDRNLVYRQKLAKGGGGEAFLDTAEGIIAIAVPICLAIIAFIFLVMCLTRADSPVCRVFEPQA